MKEQLFYEKEAKSLHLGDDSPKYPNKMTSRQRLRKPLCEEALACRSRRKRS